MAIPLSLTAIPPSFDSDLIASPPPWTTIPLFGASLTSLDVYFLFTCRGSCLIEMSGSNRDYDCLLCNGFIKGRTEKQLRDSQKEVPAEMETRIYYRCCSCGVRNLVGHNRRLSCPGQLLLDLVHWLLR